MLIFLVDHLTIGSQIQINCGSQEVQIGTISLGFVVSHLLAVTGLLGWPTLTRVFWCTANILAKWLTPLEEGSCKGEACLLCLSGVCMWAVLIHLWRLLDMAFFWHQASFGGHETQAGGMKSAPMFCLAWYCYRTLPPLSGLPSVSWLCGLEGSHHWLLHSFTTCTTSVQSPALVGNPQRQCSVLARSQTWYQVRSILNRMLGACTTSVPFAFQHQFRYHRLITLSFSSHGDVSTLQGIHCKSKGNMDPWASTTQLCRWSTNGFMFFYVIYPSNYLNLFFPYVFILLQGADSA